jgi:hypothetical protein
MRFSAASLARTGVLDSVLSHCCFDLAPVRFAIPDIITLQLGCSVCNDQHGV